MIFRQQCRPIMNIINSLKKKREEASLTMTKLSAGVQAKTKNNLRTLIRIALSKTGLGSTSVAVVVNRQGKPSLAMQKICSVRVIGQ